jgi:hypothetical protein
VLRPRRSYCSLRSLQSLCNHLTRRTTYFYVLKMQSVRCMSLHIRFMTGSNPTLSARLFVLNSLGALVSVLVSEIRGI